MSRVIKTPPLAAAPLRIGARPAPAAGPAVVSNDPGQILRAAEDQSRALLQKAEKKKADALQQSRTEGKTIKEAARQEGLKQGKDEARKQLTAEFQKQLKALTDLVAGTQEALQLQVRKNEKAIIALSIEIAAKVIKERIAADDDIIVRNAQDAIARAVQKESLTLRVSPRDLQTIRKVQEDFLISFDAIRELRIEEDNRITPGGCVVDTGSGNVEARVEKQLEELRKALLEL